MAPKESLLRGFFIKAALDLFPERCLGVIACIVKQLVQGDTGGLLDYRKIESSFKALFAQNEEIFVARKEKDPE